MVSKVKIVLIHKEKYYIKKLKFGFVNYVLKLFDLMSKNFEWS